ncbi:MAG: glycoside hydrolase family 76 protein [Streptosporangiaceae bacterium]
MIRTIISLAAAGTIILGSLAGATAASASTPAQSDTAARADMAELMYSYNSSNGLIGNSWWQAAVALDTVEAYQQATGDTSYSYAITNAFSDNEAGNFEDSYMDDTGWWGVTWLQAYQMTGDTQYLQMAETDANYIHQYWDSTCGGGVWWNTSKNYKNAIPNELFLDLTAGLHNAISGDTTYLDWANAEWSWFSASGLINSSNLINDGLTISSSGQCTNNGETTWTYNQGVILAGLAELYQATGNASLLTEAEKIANAAIQALSTGGVLVEPCEPSSCGTDGESFKGIFVQDLKYLATVAKTTAYASFFENQARSVEANDTNSSNQLGLQWTGPIDNLTSYSQASAEDAVVASLGLGSSGTVLSGVSPTLCMDDRGSGTTAGNPIQIYTCNSTEAQSWTVGSGGTLQVMGGCAAVTDGGTGNGTLIEWEPCNGGAAQVWKPQADGALRNPHSGRCLDDPDSTTSGTQLQIYTCSNTSAQHWTIP